MVYLRSYIVFSLAIGCTRMAGGDGLYIYYSSGLVTKIVGILFCSCHGTFKRLYIIYQPMHMQFVCIFLIIVSAI